MSKRDTSTQKTGNTTKNQASVFKPLIASSLALALGVSVVSATETGFYVDNGSGTVGDQVSFSGVTVGFKDTPSIDGQTYKAFTINGSIDDTFKLFFNGGSNSWSSTHFGNQGQLDLGQNSILYSSTGLAMGESGTGTLTVDMWSDASSGARTFVMDLSQVASGYAFYGNIDVTGSEGGASQYANKTFTGKFGGKGIKGDITLNALGNTNLIFNSGASIEGNINISKGTNTFTFSDGIYGSSGTKKYICFWWKHNI